MENEEKKEKKFEFCVEGDCCEERMKQPEIPSDTNCLPEDQLEEVEEDIRNANQLLLDLGLENPERNKVIKQAFSGLEGLEVEVELEEADAASGVVFIAGTDFVALLKGDKEILIPNGRVSLIKSRGRYAQPPSEALLSDIDPCFRRELTFHFGKTVSASPELIKIFFGMKLAIYLLLLQDKEISVQLVNERLEGVLWKASQDSLTLKSGDIEREIALAHVIAVEYLRKDDGEDGKEAKGELD
ncbi:hypothetical protein ACOJQI_10220 [Bacillus salacetis]|uniref:hypothetical protein n=1 Tax=Bacillus salacetis TaxID=2315464 RepID=UPI003BA0EF28